MKKLILCMLLTFAGAVTLVGQTTFRPVSATITDAAGSYTTETFDCADAKNGVEGTRGPVW